MGHSVLFKPSLNPSAAHILWTLVSMTRFTLPPLSAPPSKNDISTAHTCLPSSLWKLKELCAEKVSLTHLPRHHPDHHLSPQGLTHPACPSKPLKPCNPHFPLIQPPSLPFCSPLFRVMPHISPPCSKLTLVFVIKLVRNPSKVSVFGLCLSVYSCTGL